MIPITIEEIDPIMERWNNYCASVGIVDHPGRSGVNVYVACEQAFLFGAISQLREVDVTEISMLDVPELVRLCLQSGRPLSSVARWNPRAESIRLRGGR